MPRHPFNTQHQHKTTALYSTNLCASNSVLSVQWSDRYAMLMSPNKGDTAVHGWHCPSDMAARMREELAMLWVSVCVPLALSKHANFCGKFVQSKKLTKIVYSSPPAGIALLVNLRHISLSLSGDVATVLSSPNRKQLSRKCHLRNLVEVAPFSLGRLHGQAHPFLINELPSSSSLPPSWKAKETNTFEQEPCKCKL